MLTFLFIIFILFATCKVFILDSFRDFNYLYENILQTKCKQFGLFSYLCKFAKSLKVLILCVFTTAVFIFLTTSTRCTVRDIFFCTFLHFSQLLCILNNLNALKSMQKMMKSSILVCKNVCKICLIIGISYLPSLRILLKIFMVLYISLQLGH